MIVLQFGLGFLGFLAGADDDIVTIGPRDGTVDEDQVLLGNDFHHASDFARCGTKLPM